MRKALLASSLLSTVLLSSGALADEEKEFDNSIPHGGFIESLSHMEGWEGSVEGGVNIFNGNTNTTDVYGKFDIGHNYGRWKHALTGEALNREDSDERTAERYRLGWHSDYRFAQRWFGFVEAEYTKDRFSGFDYRINETAGLGYIIFDNDTWFWDIRAGVGAEHTKTEEGDKEDALLGRLGTDLEYHFNENVSFTQKATALFTDDLQTYRSETAVKSKISDSLSFKAGYAVERLSDVPEGRKKTDSHTFIGVVYDF